MSQRQRGPGPIPNRWLYCPRKSETIIAERFIAFKTPLSKEYNDQMPIKCLFLPEMIFGWCKTIKIKLGLWIDLTNTNRFYDRKVVENQDAQYFKLQCRGHGETPSKDQTQSFIEIVDKFIDERPFDMIGVHCTHGFNRTGFLIVSYLVERLDCSVEAALASFAQARPPGIYKQDYINELYQRYESGEDAITAPELPSWCFDYDESSDNETNHGQKHHHDYDYSSTSQQAQSNGRKQKSANEFDEDDQVDGDEDSNNGDTSSDNNQRPKKKRKRETVLKNATFMEGVPGVQLVIDQPRLEILQRKVQDMCGWEKSGFPGAQPVSMDCKNLQFLHEIPYRVSWKADGNRYMMLINKKDEVYFFDRNYSCFQVENITFLKAGRLNEHLEDTLVDGEMVIDRLNGQATPRYLIYDVVKINNADIGMKPFFPNRLDCIRKEIMEPRHKAISSGIIDRAAEPFSVRNKEFWDIRQAASLLGEKFAKALLHEPDGLIFQPSKQPYTPGVCQHVLKWKPSELNSVDFRLKINMENRPGMLPEKVGLLYVMGCDQAIAKIKLTRVLRTLDNKIVECSLNKMGEWEFLRERTDKKLPNSYTTAMSVFESIRNPVTKEILLDYITRYGCRDDQDMMPPPSSHHVHRNSHPQQHHEQAPRQNHEQSPRQHHDQSPRQHHEQVPRQHHEQAPRQHHRQMHGRQQEQMHAHQQKQMHGYQQEQIHGHQQDQMHEQRY